MFADKEAIATIAVKDLQRGKDFYLGTLGMKAFDAEEPGVLTLKSGSSKVFVYESKYAGTNEATAVTWVVDDVDGTVRDLKTKGVSFEHYELPEMKREGDVHVAGDMRAAWFKDPDGNILALVSG
jgi:catechol 2,3-dioxygenase-like lactoylglutathione lyase family enzyme